MNEMNDQLTTLALDWALRSFGPDHVYNLPLRALRTVEEAIEFAQAAGTSKALLHALVDSVYAKPRGEVEQELGGVLMTVSVACASLELLPEEVFFKELRRVLSKSQEHWVARNQAKLDAGFGVDAVR